ncbi:MAG: cyclic nucleotide-binding domain-containing protein [Cyclobacteriaceae bacterium]
MNKLFSKGTEIQLEKGALLGEQYAKTNCLYFLLSGEVGFYYHIPSMDQEVEIGKASFEYAPIGVNLFDHPYRNESTTKVTSDSATFLKLEENDIKACLDKRSDEALKFFTFLNKKAHNLIAQASELFAQTHIISKDIEIPKKPSSGYVSYSDLDQIEIVIFLLQSPFMEVFEEEELMSLAKNIKRKEYTTGEVINVQGQRADGIYVLESGEVQFSRVNNHDSGNYNVMFRSISTPGYLIGSSGILKEKSLVTSRVSRGSVILHISSSTIDILSEKSPEFALKLQKRILWLIRNQLRAIRARLISAHYDEEIVVVTGLIESNITKLNIESNLHKVPHLLNEKVTVKEALDILHDVELSGDLPEKNLASLCLDNLHHTQKEVQFFDGLKNIYNSVVQAPDDYDTLKVRHNCMVSTRQAFVPASVMISGFENLPEETGNVFIYNHLLNDPYYTLPNQFQITLDSHFLSSILFEKYGDVGQRIVRVGKNVEYGHQEYYERLNFIDVYTKDSQAIEETKEQVAKRRQLLFDTLQGMVSDGKNVIVSPEGASHTTEQSPGRFKSGMFRMILKMNPEPLLVPVVMANFDKRIKNNKFACRVMKPFKLSQHMAQQGFEDVNDFLLRYEKEYKKQIKALVKEVS